MLRKLLSIYCFTTMIFCGLNVWADSDKQIIYVTADDWCKPCQSLDAFVATLTKEQTKEWEVSTYHYKDPELHDFDLKVVAVPAMFFLHSGEVIGYRAGNMKKEEFYHILNQLEFEITQK